MLVTSKRLRIAFALACAAAVLAVGCSGSGGDGGGGGGNANLYPSSPIGAGLIDPSHILKTVDGRILISDMTGANVVKVFDAGSALQLTIGGTLGPPSSAPGSFDAPEGMTIAPSGNIYVVDSNNSRVNIYNSSGAFLSSFGDPTMTDPEAVAVDAAGNAWVVDDLASKVYAFNPAGTLVGTFGDTGTTTLSNPLDIALDGNGHLVVADTGHDRMVVFSTAGAVLGSAGTHGSGNGQFWHPVGICFDSHGNFYVNDAGNGRVVELDINKRFLFNFQYRDKKAVSSGQKTSLEGFGIDVDGSGNIYLIMAGAAYILPPHG